MTDNSYNNFNLVPQIPYNIVSYLIEQNDLIWKLLKYNTGDAWRDDVGHPNLTKEEKGLLVYDGLKSETDCRVFLDIGADDVWTQQVSILRVSVAELIPTNYVVGYATIVVEIYSHYLINTLSNYQPRDLTIAQEIIKTLNGAEIGGLGRLYFDYSKNPKTKMVTLGSTPYKGKGIIFCNWVV